jgi:hypothetical protein
LAKIQVATVWKQWNGPTVAKKVLEASRNAVWLAGNMILHEAVAEVPLDKSPLMNSGMVLLHQSEAEACICFGGGPGTGKPIIPYAIRWHENNANFQRGRKMRYLIDPANRLLPSVLYSALQLEFSRILA